MLEFCEAVLSEITGLFCILASGPRVHKPQHLRQADSSVQCDATPLYWGDTRAQAAAETGNSN